MKTIDPKQLEMLTRKLIWLLSKIQAPEKCGKRPEKSIDQSYPDYQDEILAYEKVVSEYNRKLVIINRIVTQYINYKLCRMLGFKQRINVGDFELYQYGYTVSIRRVNHFKQGTNLSYEPIEMTIPDCSVFDDSKTWYIQKELIVSPVILSNPIFKDRVTKSHKALLNPRIINVKEAGGFYTVEEGSLLFAPMNSDGTIEMEDEEDVPNWQQVDEMPADVFPFVLPVIEKLAGDLKNVQSFELY